MRSVFQNNRKKGSWGEEKAHQYLLEEGYSLVERNFSSRLGEIDLIYTFKENIVFVEVKVENDSFPAIERITTRKKQHILKTIDFFFSLHPEFLNLQPRIDLVIIKKDSKVVHLKGVF